MTISLNSFSAEIRTKGVQPLNRFLVEFQPPKNELVATASEPKIISNTTQMILRCAAVSFPGVILMVKDDIVRYGHGPVDKTVHNALYTDIQCAFILDGDGVVYDFFHRWQRSIAYADSSIPMSSTQTGRTPYEVAYKDDYVTTLNVTQFAVTGQPVMTAIAQKAFPLNVGEQILAWEGGNAISVLPVTFTYRDHKIIKYGTNQLASTPSPAGPTATPNGGYQYAPSVNSGKIPVQYRSAAGHATNTVVRN